MIAPSSSLALMAGMIAALCVTPAAAAVTISTDATANMSCVSGVCTPTAADAVLNVSDLTTMLGSGNVVVSTGTGKLAQHVQNIVVTASFNWANASSLTLDAYDSVTVSQPVAVNGTGAVVLTTNDGGTGGMLWFGSTGSLSFLGTTNSLTINGTPYTLVNSIASLASAIAANGSGSYALSHNYDASADGTYRTSPIPGTTTGNFQGLGNTISNLTLRVHRKRGIAGLFTDIGSSGTVENLRLTSVQFFGYNRYTGGGGLTYTNEGLLFGDEVSGELRSKGACCSWGGLVGANYDGGKIVQSSADVHIYAESGGGGLVSFNLGTISLSRASGTLEGARGFVEGGGVVAVNEGDVEQSFSSMAVTGGTGTYLGGLIGLDEGSTSNSYATGAVTGGDMAVVGGFDGYTYNGQTLTTSYSTGAVSAGSGGSVGGFLGGEDEQLSNCYWDTTTSGTDNGTGDGNKPGITGLTTTQLQSGLPAGFDPTIWAENPSINNGFPYLIANPPQ